MKRSPDPAPTLPRQGDLDGILMPPGLLDRLGQSLAIARRRNEMMAVMCFTVDDFARLADRVGPSGCERLLEEVSRRVTSVLRESDQVVHMGSDTFLVVASRIGSLEQAQAVAGRVVARAGDPLQLDGHWVSPSISLGVAVYPEHARTPETLVAKSDACLRQARRDGKGRYAFASGPAA